MRKGPGKKGGRYKDVTKDRILI